MAYIFLNFSPFRFNVVVVFDFDGGQGDLALENLTIRIDSERIRIIEPVLDHQFVLF